MFCARRAHMSHCSKELRLGFERVPIKYWEQLDRRVCEAHLSHRSTQFLPPVSNRARPASVAARLHHPEPARAMPHTPEMSSNRVQREAPSDGVHLECLGCDQARHDGRLAENVRLRAQVLRLQRRNERLRKLRTYWKSRAQCLDRQNRKRIAEIASLRSPYAHHTKRPRPSHRKSTRVSICGGYRLAIQRNIAHTGAKSLMRIVDARFNKCTLFRWERLLAANLVLQHRQWVQARYDYSDHARARRSIRGAKVGAQDLREVHDVAHDASRAGAGNAAEVEGAVRWLNGSSG